MGLTFCHGDKVVLITTTAFENKGLASTFGCIKVKSFSQVFASALEMKIKTVNYFSIQKLEEL